MRSLVICKDIFNKNKTYNLIIISMHNLIYILSVPRFNVTSIILVYNVVKLNFIEIYDFRV